MRILVYPAPHPRVERIVAKKGWLCYFFRTGTELIRYGFNLVKGVRKKMAVNKKGSYAPHHSRLLLTRPHRPTKDDKTSSVIAAKSGEAIKRSGVPTGPMRHQ